MERFLQMNEWAYRASERSTLAGLGGAHVEQRYEAYRPHGDELEGVPNQDDREGEEPSGGSAVDQRREERGGVEVGDREEHRWEMPHLRPRRERSASSAMLVGMYRRMMVLRWTLMVQIRRSMATVLSESAPTRMKRIGQPTGLPSHRVERRVKLMKIPTTNLPRVPCTGKTWQDIGSASATVVVGPGCDPGS